MSPLDRCTYCGQPGTTTLEVGGRMLITICEECHKNLFGQEKAK